MTQNMFSGNDEPSLAELLEDKIARLLRARDGLQIVDVEQVIDEARAALAHRPLRACRGTS